MGDFTQIAHVDIDFCSAGLLFRPKPIFEGPLASPVVARIEPFGMMVSDYSWDYTEAPGSGGKFNRWGSAVGGLVLLPPEVDIYDYGNEVEFVSSHHPNVSSTCFTAAGGAYWAVGNPDTLMGGVYDGYSWIEDSGGLLFRSHNNEGTVDNAVRFDSSQNIGWRSNTDYWGTLEHAITADRTWTFPNLTGNVSLNSVTGGLFTSTSVPFAASTGALSEDSTFTFDSTTKILRMTGVATTATTKSELTADQNNYAIGNGSFFRMSTDAARTVTGIAGGVDGRHLYISNIGSNNLVLANESGSSTAGNRILTGTGGDLTLAANDSAILIYDATTARWRVFST